MSLRAAVYSGGAILVFRQALGIIINLGGALALTALLGTGPFGLYAALFAVYTYLFALGQCGLAIYLIRNRQAQSDAMCDQAFTLLLLFGLIGYAGAILLTPAIGYWLNAPAAADLIPVMFAILPVQLIATVPIARMECDLRYRKIATIELSGQLLFYTVALALATAGLGALAPVIGLWVQQLAISVSAYVTSGNRPRLRWSTSEIREMLAYGLAYDSSIWVWNLRNLVNPVIVGRFAGVEAVGIVALAIRVTDALVFVKNVTWRLSIPAMAKVQTEPSRISRMIEEGLELQALVLIPILLGFSVAGPLLFEYLFAPEWQPLFGIYPMLAIAYLFNAAFVLHCSALYVMRRNCDMTLFHAIHVALFASSAAFLVPRFGLMGYGLAEMVALVSYLAVHRFAVRAVGPLQVGTGLLWIAAGAVALLWPWIGIWAAAVRSPSGFTPKPGAPSPGMFPVPAGC